MSDRPKLVKRIRRKLMGGNLEMRIYDNGSMRLRTDHPTNDPATEIAMMAAIVGYVTDLYERYGLGRPDFGVLTLRDDP